MQLHPGVMERKVRDKKIILSSIPLLTLQWLEPKGHMSFGKSLTSEGMKSPMLAQVGKSRGQPAEFGEGQEILNFSTSPTFRYGNWLTA